MGGRECDNSRIIGVCTGNGVGVFLGDVNGVSEFEGVGKKVVPRIAGIGKEMDVIVVPCNGSGGKILDGMMGSAFEKYGSIGWIPIF